MDKSKPYIKPFNAFKPRPFENKNYIIEEKIDFDKIIKIYSDFVTLPYNDINDYFNENLILNFRNEDGRTLISAVLTNSSLNEQEKKLIIEKLIHLNVSINSHDCYNQTPLHIACKNGYNSIIELLIEHKIMKDTVDNYGNAPVHYYIDNFLKECKNSDMFNNNKLLITSEEKTNSSTITHLLLAEILEKFNVDPNLKTYSNIIKKLVDLIPYFKIGDINNKVDIVNKEIENLRTNISGININKDINKLVNNFNDDIYKIYDEYKLSENNIYDKNEFDKEIDIELLNKNKNEIEKNYKELEQILHDVNKNIFQETEGLFNKSINFITMSLFILMYIIYNRIDLEYELREVIDEEINNATLRRSLQQNLRQIRQQINQKTQRQIQINHQLIGKQGQITALQNQYAIVMHRLNLLAPIPANLQQIQNLEKERSKIIKELTQLQNESTALNQEIPQLQQEIIDLQQEVADLQNQIQLLQELTQPEIDNIAANIYNKIINSIDAYLEHFNSNIKEFEYYNYLTKSKVKNVNKITSKGLDTDIDIKLLRFIPPRGMKEEDKYRSSLTFDDNKITGNPEIAVIEKANDFLNYINSRAINFNTIPSYKYKHNNIHFIFKLLNEIFKNNLDLDIDKNNISYNNIITIYNKYELIICIINNLVLIYKNIDNIENDDLIQMQTTFNDINESFIYYHNHIKINLLNSDHINKFKLCETFIDFIYEYKGIYKDVKKDFNKIYRQLTSIIDKYNDIIDLVNKNYSIKYFEEFKKFYELNKQPNINNIIFNQFNKLNLEKFPKTIDEYINKYFEPNSIDINYDNIKELYVYYESCNFNIIYNNLKPDNNIYTQKSIITIDKKNNITIAESSPIIITNKSLFTTGYFTNDNEITFSEPDTNLLYDGTFKNIKRDEKSCKYLIKDTNNLTNIEDIPIISIFNYNQLLYFLMFKCKEILIQNKQDIFKKIKSDFEKLIGSKEKLVKKDNKENKKIIKNLDKLINDNSSGDAVIINHLNNLMKIIIEYQFTLNSIKITKILLTQKLFKIFSIKEYNLFINEAKNESIIIRIKNIADKNTFILNKYENINYIEDSAPSNRLIKDVCINTDNINIINKFKFNLRVEDKNGNTIVHRLIDQYNYYAIDKLLSFYPEIKTYENHAGQDPKKYLINLINIISNEYSKKEINKRLENYAYVLQNEIKAQGFTNIEINNQPKYIQVVLYNSINQFNDFLWLSLYEFKNNITLSNITDLKNIITKHFTSINSKNQINLIEDLIINDLINYKDIKIELKNMFTADKINEKISKMYKQNNDEIADLKKSIKEFTNLLCVNKKNGTKGIITEDEINKKIKKIENEISEKEKENINIEFVLKNITNVDEIISNIFTEITKSTLIDNLKLDFDKFAELSKKLCENYFKILNLIYSNTHTNIITNNKIYMCDFNYLLINIKLDKLNTDEFITYEKYFTNFINSIFEDYNDLEKIEDFEVNYVNYTILNIIKINLVNTISCEIYNYIVKYLVDKYINIDTKETNEMYDKYKKIILKNIKDFINNKIYDKLNLKNPSKEYKTEDENKKLIKENVFIGIIKRNKDTENKESDDTQIENILKFYGFIAENIAYYYYEEIKRYLDDLRKIILLLKIYNILK
jgi:predicted  nucleic acid-binding Zn-ribbon protein